MPFERARVRAVRVCTLPIVGAGGPFLEAAHGAVNGRPYVSLSTAPWYAFGIMGRTCTVCRHADRRTVDAAIASGTPYRRIAAQYELKAAAVGRHAKAHLPLTLARAVDAQEAAAGGALLERVLDLERRATALLDAAEADPRRTQVALSAMREVRACIELLARVAGTFPPARVPAEVELHEHPEFAAHVAQMTGVLARFPDAAAAVAAALDPDAGEAQRKRPALRAVQ